MKRVFPLILCAALCAALSVPACAVLYSLLLEIMTSVEQRKTAVR